jgi:hypothetical protein
MSKKNKYKQIQQAQKPQQAQIDAGKKQQPDSIEALIDKAYQINEEIPVGEKEDIPAESLPQTVSEQDLHDALLLAEEAKISFQKLVKKNEEEKAIIESSKNDLNAEKEKWRAEREEISVLKKEKEQGFRQDRERILADAEKYKKDVSEQFKQLNAQKQEFEEQKQKQDEAMEAFERDRRLFEQKLRMAVADKEEEFRLEKLTYEKMRIAMEGHVKKLAETEKALMEAEDKLRRSGQEDIDTLESRISSLIEENNQLRAAIKKCPSADLEPQVNELRSQNQRFQAEIAKLNQTNAILKAQNERMRNDALSIENLREENELLEAKCQIHQQAVAEIKKDLENYLNREQGALVFPSCKEMDEDPELQQEPYVSDETIDLKSFCNDLRNCFAGDYERYYTIEDIRCFVAGMAASRLIILQGLSGTGKTTLPSVFSKVIGADSENMCIIPIQAGWRDRSDLIGHYNSFDKKYYETKFLKALYRAQTPRFFQKPYLIVLDEMNLSYAEQYFADFISLMEQNIDEDKKELELITHAPKAVQDVLPEQLISKEGISIRLPKNVWFIGTANHDETTMDFAEKTYDRAHVMELPNTAVPFKSKSTTLLNEVSYIGIQNAFEKAQKDYATEAELALNKLERHFRKRINDKFRINWGNRLVKQTKAFLPVLLACGGSEAEAMDHIFCTKIIRKLKTKHDIAEKDLLELGEFIDIKQPFGGEMKKTLAAINLLKSNSITV